MGLGTDDPSLLEGTLVASTGRQDLLVFHGLRVNLSLVFGLRRMHRIAQQQVLDSLTKLLDFATKVNFSPTLSSDTVADYVALLKSARWSQQLVLVALFAQSDT